MNNGMSSAGCEYDGKSDEFERADVYFYAKIKFARSERPFILCFAIVILNEHLL